MVQIIEEQEGLGAKFGRSLGGGIAGALKAYVEVYRQKQKQAALSKALGNLQDVYGDPDLSSEEKFVKAFSTLQEFPEVAEKFSSGLSKFTESPLQKAQRQKLEQETQDLRGEQSYFDRLMGEGKAGEEGQEPSIAGFYEDEEVSPKTPRFNVNDPSSWTDKQINNFRGIEGKTSKAKTLSKMAQNEFDRRQESKKAVSKYQENIAPFESALEILDEMEKLGKKGNLGIGTRARGIISPRTRKDAAQYERLGKSLISYSSNIPIRNRQEFETLAHDLYDPSISDDAREGILLAMKKIIQNSMKSYQEPEGAQAVKSEKKERPPLTSFLR